ncbi:MAG: hypothetical protein ACP5I1_10030 [Candidatus Hinthialibacter sp.]
MKTFKFLFAGLIAAAVFGTPGFSSEKIGAAGYHIYAHAHNDYEHERPLLGLEEALSGIALAGSIMI